MKKYYYFGLAGLALFEILNVYFIMPMPGSQQLDSIGIAYFLYSWRWVFRIVFVGMILAGIKFVFNGKKKLPPVLLLLFTTGIVYLFNFKMSADKMFVEPNAVILKPASQNKIPGDRLVIGIEKNGEAKAYPVEFLTFHHQVRDTLGGDPVMVTYCSVCRTGRVYEPVVQNHQEQFRLVGMDHFNAMFEDATTGSWWRQSTGQAVAGKLKGSQLPELSSLQVTVNKWFEMYPDGKVMQADVSFLNSYDSLSRFEKGKSMGKLTRKDSLPWKEKSWVVGIQIKQHAKAYDWNELLKQNIINDTIATKSIVLVIADDKKSFAAFMRPPGKIFYTRNDSLITGDASYDFFGRSKDLKQPHLKPIKAYQEFWHSWQTFHKQTTQYKNVALE